MSRTRVFSRPMQIEPAQVLPTPLREQADDKLTGKGVTIAFIDSGFTRHPDLVYPENRIVAYHDATGEDASLDDPPQIWNWHGTQTTVVCAGNGYMSQGRYRSIAPEARLVLVRAINNQMEMDEDMLARCLQWILDNRERYNIRVLNISVGAGSDGPISEDRANQLAEDAVAAGITVVVAAGNMGLSDEPNTLPPANAPSVITVGGYEDHNQMDSRAFSIWPSSSYGLTVDGFIKPELLAPSSGVAAPLVTDTEVYRRALALFELAETPAASLGTRLKSLASLAGLPDDAYTWKTDRLERAAQDLLMRDKLISAHYQHVDGTSFASPITASVVAQMLEANPSLTPGNIKYILISTARRMWNLSKVRQGFGRIQARAAVEWARKPPSGLQRRTAAPPHVAAGQVHFYYWGAARSVEVAGEFNGWDGSQLPMHEVKPERWAATLRLPDPGRYAYKFVIDGTRWLEDPSHGHQIPDGMGGFNSLLDIE